MAKRTHRILAAFIALCMITALFPAAVMAEENVPETGGMPISSAADLLKFANEVNEATREAGATYTKNAYLTNDIDLSGQEMISIAKTNHVGSDNAWEETSGFAGTFDGNGHEIRNLNLVRVYDENDPDAENSIYKCGLFGTIHGGTIKNLVVKGTVNETSNRSLVSLFAGSAVGAKFMNCGAEGATSSYGAAAFIGTTEHGGGNTIFNCWASVDDEASGGFDGFIGNEGVGEKGTPNTIEHCYNHVKTDNQWHVFTTSGRGDAMAGGLAAAVNDLNNDGEYFKEDPTGTFHTWTVPDRGGKYPIFSGVSYTKDDPPVYKASASSTELGLDVLVNGVPTQENIPNQKEWIGTLTAIGGTVENVNNVFMGKLALTRSDTYEDLDLGEYYYNNADKSVTIKSVTNNIIIEAQLALRHDIYVSQEGAGDKDARDAANACEGFDTAMAIANSSTEGVTLTVHVVGDLMVTDPAHVEYADLTIAGEDADGKATERKITPAAGNLEDQNLLTLSDGVDLTLKNITFEDTNAVPSSLTLKNVISAGSQSSVELVDSKIQNFSVYENGSALKAGMIVVGGAAAVSGNTDVNNKAANMYLGKEQKIHGIDALTSGARIGVTCGDAADGRGLSQTALPAAGSYAQYFSSDSPGYKITANAADDNLILAEYVYYIGEAGEDTLQKAIDKADASLSDKTVKIGDTTGLANSSDSGTLTADVSVEDKDGTTFSGEGVTLSVDKPTGEVTITKTEDGEVPTSAAVNAGQSGEANFKAQGASGKDHDVSIGTNGATVDTANGLLKPNGAEGDSVVIDGVTYSGAEQYDLDDPASNGVEATVPKTKGVKVPDGNGNTFNVQNAGNDEKELTVTVGGDGNVKGEITFGMGEKASVQIGDGSPVIYESTSKNNGTKLDLVNDGEKEYVELKGGSVIVPDGGKITANTTEISATAPITVTKNGDTAAVIVPVGGSATINETKYDGYKVITIDKDGEDTLEDGAAELKPNDKVNVDVDSSQIVVENKSTDKDIYIDPPAITSDGKGRSTVPKNGTVDIKKSDADNGNTYHVPENADDDNNVFEFDGGGKVTLVDGEVELGAEDTIGLGNVEITGSDVTVGGVTEKVILKSENDGGTIIVPVEGGVAIGDGFYVNDGTTPLILKTDDDGNVTLVDGTVAVYGPNGEITINGEKYKTGKDGATLEKPVTGDIPTLKEGSVVLPAPVGTDVNGLAKINVETDEGVITTVSGGSVEVTAGGAGTAPSVKGSGNGVVSIDGFIYTVSPDTTAEIYKNGELADVQGQLNGRSEGNTGTQVYVIVPGNRANISADPSADVGADMTVINMAAGSAFDVQKKKTNGDGSTNDSNLEDSIGHYVADLPNTKAVVDHKTGDVTLTDGALTILPGIVGDTSDLIVAGQTISTTGATVAATKDMESGAVDGANITLDEGQSFTVNGKTYTAGEDGAVFHMDKDGNVTLISGTDVYPKTNEGGSDVTASVSAGEKTYEVSGSGITLSKAEGSETATVTVPKSGSAKVDENIYANAGNTEMIIVLGADGAVLNSGSAAVGSGQTINAKSGNVPVKNTGDSEIKVSVVVPEDAPTEEYTTVEIPKNGGSAKIGDVDISVPGELPVMVTIGKDGKPEIDPEHGASFKIGDVTYTNEGSSAAITFDENGGVVIPAGAKISETVDVPTTKPLVLKPGEVVKYTTSDGRTITLKGGPENGATVTIDKDGNVTSTVGEVLIKLDPENVGTIGTAESGGKVVFVGDVAITVNDGESTVAEADVTITAGGKEYTGKTAKDGNVTIKDVPYGNDYKVEIKSGDKASEYTLSVSEPAPSASFDLNGGEVTPGPTPSDEPIESAAPSSEPSSEPSETPTDEPSAVPTDEPTTAPTDEPTMAPTDEPTTAPTDEPTTAPTDEPTTAPTDEPTTAPTDEPITAPTDEPTTAPSDQPTDEPTAAPSNEPTETPAPTRIPSTGGGIGGSTFSTGGGSANYGVNTPAAPKNGSVTANVKDAAPGAKVTITVKPDDGYSVGAVTVRDANGNTIAVTDNGDGTYSFTMPSGSVSVDAEFVEGETPKGSADPEATAVPSVDENTCPRDNTCPISKFGDASPNDWYHDGVHYCLDRGIMNGYDDGRFGPNDGLTRGMVAQMLYNLNGRPAAAASGFADVSADSWYADAIAWARHFVIVEGYDATTFGPEDLITREQMAAIIYRYEIAAGGNAQIPAEFAFPDDNLVSDWAYSAVVWNAAQGIIKGDENGMFRPADNITRAEAATMLQRWLEPHVKDASGLKF